MKLTGSTITMITYLLVGLTAFCCSTIKGVKGNELKLRAREKMCKDRAERQLQADNAGLVFSRGYICITRPQDFAFVIPQQKSTVPAEFKLLDLNLLGSSTIQSGGIYDPADVQIVDRLGTSAADNFDDELNPGGPIQVTCNLNSDCDTDFPDDTCEEGFCSSGTRCANNLGCRSDEVCLESFGLCFQVLPKQDGPRRQFAGQRQPKFIPQKDPGFFFNGECVATQVQGTLILGHSCLLNLCLGGGGYNCLAIYAGSKFVFNPLEQVLFSPSTFTDSPNNAGSIVPSLPPSYPGTIIGGTGLFVGAVGYVDVTTITGSTLTPANEFTETINASAPQAGYITQKINVVTNVPLPVAP